MAAGRSFSFGPFTIDWDTRRLVQGPDRRTIHLSPKAYELLRVLVETSPRAVSKAELHEHLWPSTFVSDATLASLVAEVRQALGDNGRAQGLVRTLHGFGYAFAAQTCEARPQAVAQVSSWIICNGREQMLSDGEHVIGRDIDVAVNVNSPGVSRRHARVTIAGGVAILDDLGSKNGTYLRGCRISAPVRLVDGDRFRIASFEITYRSLVDGASTQTVA